MKFIWNKLFKFSFFYELFCFAFSIYLAIGVALRLAVKSASANITPPVGDKLDLWEFVLLFLAATLILYLLQKYFHRPWVLKFLFYFAILQGIWLFGLAFFDWPKNFYFLIFVICMWAAYRNVFMHNLVIVLALSAISVIFGLAIWPSTGILILLFIAIYDFWAVYKTTHMVKMFQGLAETKVYYALIIPHSLKGLLKKMKEVSPHVDFMFLGTGDIALPSIFVVSCLKISLLTSLITLAGAVAGFILLYVLFVAQKETKPMPGLPLIVLGTLLGYLVAIII